MVSVTFSTQIWGVGNNAGIVVPPEAVEQLGAGKRAPVLVSVTGGDVNGYEYRNTIGSMGGQPMISFNAAVRIDTGLGAGDDVTVTLTVMEEPREVNVPADFAAALDAAGVRPFFDSLANSLQRFHIDTINGTKVEETRARRIAAAVSKFAEGKKR
jgi:hypothetical protein